MGQNEAGKSNLFEALYCINPFIPSASYNADEDWPVDDWSGRVDANGKLVCEAEFELAADEIADLYRVAGPKDDTGDGVENIERDAEAARLSVPQHVVLRTERRYGHATEFLVEAVASLDAKKLTEWAREKVPKFVYISDYEMSGAQVELTELKERLDKVGRKSRDRLSSDDQTILIILDLAQIDIDDFLKKGSTSEGRTIRSFDKRAASAFLTKQFQKLWSQKTVKFDIEIDGSTLNIFVEDAAIGMPVRLKRRSTGFRWYVSFAWKFTHASRGAYQNCILLLEEPGIYLHYSGQRDLPDIFNRLSTDNTILYSTHLASMVDLAFPERVRIVESRKEHLAVTEGVVSTQSAPMAVIETSLGLTPDLSGMLGNRHILIVEGGTDALVLNKISGLLRSSGGIGLSDYIHIWPAQTASKAPMYAAFAVGQRWSAAVLLDSDSAGHEARRKIDNLVLKAVAKDTNVKFRVLMLADAAGLTKTEAGIEDLFEDEFYMGCVNEAYGLNILAEDLPCDGSDMIASRLERVLQRRYDHKSLDKKRVLSVMLRRFDTWSTRDDLPPRTAESANSLFAKINRSFEQPS